jgi:predicted  nucleic acid-binding Zn-ribbon protein
MGIVNRIINVLILILAIGSAALSFLLFQKREKFVKGWDAMASEVVKTAQELDKASGTKVASSYQGDALKHTANLEDIRKALPGLSKHASEVIVQRDALASALREVASTLELEGVAEAEEFKAIAKYKTNNENLLALVGNVQKRNNGLINQMVQASRKVGVNMSAADLKDFSKYKKSIGAFSSKVAKIKSRITAYEDHIKEMASTVEAESPSLEGEDYNDSLKDAVSAAGKVVSQRDQLKRDLESERDKLKTIQSSLEGKEQEVSGYLNKMKQKDEEIAKLKKENNFLKNPDGEGGNEPLPIAQDDPKLLKLLKGKIIETNNRWDFVVIDLGEKSKVSQKIGQKDVEMPTPLPLNQEMVVARSLGDDNEFVGKIKIVKVYDNCAIGNVLPYPKTKLEVRKGDVVYFSDDAIARIAEAQKKPAVKADDKENEDGEDGEEEEDEGDEE